jgi:hypothetical protein
MARGVTLPNCGLDTSQRQAHGFPLNANHFRPGIIHLTSLFSLLDWHQAAKPADTERQRRRHQRKSLIWRTIVACGLAAAVLA